MAAFKVLYLQPLVRIEGIELRESKSVTVSPRAFGEFVVRYNNPLTSGKNHSARQNSSNGCKGSVSRLLRGQERSLRKAMCRQLRRKPESQGRHPANSYASAFVLCPLMLLGSHRWAVVPSTPPLMRRRLDATDLPKLSISHKSR